MWGITTGVRSMNGIHTQLLTIATQLFADQGYEGTSMRQIAQQCDVASASLFHYYPSKQALYQACLENTLHSFSNGGGAMEKSYVSMTLQALLFPKVDVAQLLKPHLEKCHQTMGLSHWLSQLGQSLWRYYLLPCCSAVNQTDRGENLDRLDKTEQGCGGTFLTT